MSTAEFGDPNLGHAPAPAPAPAPDGQITPLTLSATAPVEPVAQPVVAAPVEAPVAPVPVSDMRDVPLGTLIFREGLLTEEQLEEALQDGMKRGKRLGEVLLERGLVSENDLGRLLAGQKGLQFVQLDAAAVDPSAVQLLPAEKARLHSVLPIGFRDGLPVVAVADPSNDLVVENVRRALNCEPHLVVAGREGLHRQIEIAYAAVPAAAAPVVDQPALVGQVAPAAPVPAPVAPVVPAEPVAPVVPDEPFVSPAVEAVAPVAPPAAPVIQPQAPAEGVWLGTPEAALQPAPVVQPEPLLVQPQPVLQAEPVLPIEPVAAPEAAVTPEPVVVPEPVVASEPIVAPEPVVASQPVVVPEPVITTEPAVVMPPAPQPVAEPLAISYAPVEPAVAAEPPVVVPEPALDGPAQPVHEPAPTEDPELVLTWSVVLRLADGDRLDIGTFHSSNEAKEQAKSIVEQISADSGWPFFDGRFIRPDAIVSVDLVEPEGRWLGSAARRAALEAQGR